MITTLLLRDCSDWREIGTQKFTTQKTFIKTQIVQQTKHQWQTKSKCIFFWNTRSWMGPLIDENKLQLDEKNNKNWKAWKILENVYHKVYLYSL